MINRYDLGISLLESNMLAEAVFNHVAGIDKLDLEWYRQPIDIADLKLRYKEKLFNVSFPLVQLINSPKRKYIRSRTDLILHEYILRDDSGFIPCVTWNANELRKYLESIEAGSYVSVTRATYQFKDYQGEWQLTIKVDAEECNLRKV